MTNKSSTQYGDFKKQRPVQVQRAHYGWQLGIGIRLRPGYPYTNVLIALGWWNVWLYIPKLRNG